MVLVLKKGASKKEMEQMNKKLRQMPSRKKLDAKKYCGVIKLKEDPLVIQKRLRDEWELARPGYKHCFVSTVRR